jgi:hypothetical protein
VVLVATSETAMVLCPLHQEDVLTAAAVAPTVPVTAAAAPPVPVIINCFVNGWQDIISISLCFLAPNSQVNQ